MGEKVWKFQTARFEVALYINPSDELYDGDDENGETQRAIDNGDLVMFDAYVTVKLDGNIVGAAGLCLNVYETGHESDFWTAHRDPDPMNRNCSLMRAAKGENVVICHYFPDMVKVACAEARATLANAPAMRKVA